jgi:hypothetical protein
LDIASAIMYGCHLEYRISQSLRNLTHSHHTTRATGDESVIVLCHVTIRVHQNLFSNRRLFYRGGCSTWKTSFTERISKYQLQIAPYMVSGLVENTLVSVFFEFQQNTTIYRRKFAKHWRGMSQRKLDGEIDGSLRNQITQQTLHVCERHFEKTQPKHVSYFLSLVEVLIFRYDRLKVTT